MLTPGDEVDRYVVEAELGRGGMAMVFRVRHKHLGTRHALKLLLVSLPDVRARLLAEGRVQARLRHPNLVSVSDVLLVDRSPALVMDLVDGPALDAWLIEHQPSLEVALELFRGILTGVGAAHAMGVVHRDLKPANVLLATVGSRLVPRVMDFGLVKTVGAERNHTRTGAALGTPAYMAPEQIRDPSTVDGRADLWALGCLLYELVTGARAFPERDAFDLYAAIRSGQYVDPGDLRPDLPARVRDLIRALLRVDPDERPPTCSAVHEALYDGPVPLELLTPTDPATPAPVSEEAMASLSVDPRKTQAAPLVVRAGGPGWLGYAAVLVMLGVVLFGMAVLWSREPGPTVPDPILTTTDRRPPEPEPAEPTPTLPEPAPAQPPPAPIVGPRPPPAQPRPPAPLPTPDPIGSAAVRIEGDAREVWLQVGAQRIEAGGTLRPGTYQLYAAWADREAGPVGEVLLTPGDQAVVRCASFLYRCTIEIQRE